MASSDEKVDIHMPLFIGDYLADTTDLTTEEHGAYLLIMMDLWRRRGVTTSDAAKLARIAKLAPARWKSVWAALSRFFTVDGETMRQKRLSKELEKALGRRKAASESGARGAAKRWGGHSDPIGEPSGGGICSPLAKTVAKDGSLSPSSPSEDLGVAPAHAPAIPDGPYAGPREGRRPLDRFAAATSGAFERVFFAYPRKDARVPASHAFQLAALTFPGGEEALADAILAAFPAMLKRAPYNGPNDKRPFLETVIAEWRWEDPPSAPDPESKAGLRCWYHQKPGTNGKRSNKPDPLCPECRHVSAGAGTREAEPVAPAAALPAYLTAPPPQWTAEQKAEFERVRRGEAPGEPQAATGGTS